MNDDDKRNKPPSGANPAYPRRRTDPRRRTTGLHGRDLMGLFPFRNMKITRDSESFAQLFSAEETGGDELEPSSPGQKPPSPKRAAFPAESISFRQAAERYLETQIPCWRGEKHKAQWEMTLNRYVHPVMGDLPVNLIEVGHVMNVLAPIWIEKTETAGKVRERIEAILRWAHLQGYRTGDNPARWKGQLEKLLPLPDWPMWNQKTPSAKKKG